MASQKRMFRFEKSVRKERWFAISGLRGTLEQDGNIQETDLFVNLGCKYLKKPTLGEQISSPFAGDAVRYRQL